MISRATYGITRRNLLRTSSLLMAGALAERSKAQIIGEGGRDITEEIIGKAASSESLDIVKKLKITEEQKRELLGIGNPIAKKGNSHVAWGGWQGEGIYVFQLKNVKTPYLKTKSQLNNWNYVLFHELRIEPGMRIITNPHEPRNQKIEPQGVDKEVKRAVDEYYDLMKI